MAQASLKALFLHWGPGGNCAVERTWFAQELPIAWWDQPQFQADDPRAFSKLVDSAEAELERLATGTPLALVGHSFGGQLALALSQRRPELVSEIVLLGAGEWPPRAFVSLAAHLSARGFQIPNDVLAAARDSLHPGTFWPLVGAITAIPDFMGHYWGEGSAEQRVKYLSLADPATMLDLPTYTAVMSEVLGAPRLAAPSPFKGPVRLIRGEQDPLFDAKIEVPLWKERFPQLRETVARTGHFLHLELPARDWFTY